MQERYIIQVRRIARTWEYTVQVGELEFKFPGKVFDWIASYRKSILEEQRRDRAENNMRRIAAQDQAAAAREPDGPAGAVAFLGRDDDDA